MFIHFPRPRANRTGMLTLVAVAIFCCQSLTLSLVPSHDLYNVSASLRISEARSVHSPIYKPFDTKLDAECNKQATVVGRLLLTLTTVVGAFAKFFMSRVAEGSTHILKDYQVSLKHSVCYVEGNLNTKNPAQSIQPFQYSTGLRWTG